MLGWTTIRLFFCPPPMLVKNCCYTVIVFYVGNKRCCIVLYRIALYCIVIVIVIPANPNHSSIGGYCYQASHLHPVDPYIIPCSLPLLTVNNTLVTANQVLFVLLPFLQWCPFCPLYPSLIDHNQQISNSQSRLFVVLLPTVLPHVYSAPAETN